MPEVGQALRVAQDPLVGQLIAGLTGVDLGGMATTFSQTVDDAIWSEIGREEAAIRADPARDARSGADRRRSEPSARRSSTGSPSRGPSLSC